MEYSLERNWLFSPKPPNMRHTAYSAVWAKNPKTKKYRAVTMNIGCFEAIQQLLEELDRKALASRDLSWVDDEAYLFAGRRSDRALTVPTLNNLVKDWCRKVNLKGNYGSHTLRKTWGYMQRTKQNTPIPLLMQALDHATQQQTLAYLCIQDEEIESIYTTARTITGRASIRAAVLPGSACTPTCWTSGAWIMIGLSCFRQRQARAAIEGVVRQSAAESIEWLAVHTHGFTEVGMGLKAID